MQDASLDPQHVGFRALLISGLLASLVGKVIFGSINGGRRWLQAVLLGSMLATALFCQATTGWLLTVAWCCIRFFMAGVWLIVLRFMAVWFRPRLWGRVCGGMAGCAFIGAFLASVVLQSVQQLEGFSWRLLFGMTLPFALITLFFILGIFRSQPKEARLAPADQVVSRTLMEKIQEERWEMQSGLQVLGNTMNGRQFWVLLGGLGSLTAVQEWIKVEGLLNIDHLPAETPQLLLPALLAASCSALLAGFFEDCHKLCALLYQLVCLLLLVTLASSCLLLEELNIGVVGVWSATLSGAVVGPLLWLPVTRFCLESGRALWSCLLGAALQVAAGLIAVVWLGVCRVMQEHDVGFTNILSAQVLLVTLAAALFAVHAIGSYEAAPPSYGAPIKYSWRWV